MLEHNFMANQNFAKTSGFRSAGHIYQDLHYKNTLSIRSKVFWYACIINIIIREKIYELGSKYTNVTVSFAVKLASCDLGVYHLI